MTRTQQLMESLADLQAYLAECSAAHQAERDTYDQDAIRNPYAQGTEAGMAIAFRLAAGWVADRYYRYAPLPGTVTVQRDLCGDRWWVVECTICGTEYEYSGGTKAAFAEELTAQGWRQAASETYANSGLTCPDCLAAPYNRCTPTD